jgi:hypothetical protein
MPPHHEIDSQAFKYLMWTPSSLWKFAELSSTPYAEPTTSNWRSRVTKIPCITLEDKSRLNIQKRNTPGGQGNINGGGYGK